ncbi:MAG: ribonuclease HI [Candidatus Pelagibacterales bacterium]|jgi:ribonuclease HI|nr:ribonuclease HI [Pelagibacterales bacterium]MDB9818608.1 ribonuclease HI [Pelagibacterales bacterium]|tara:strand:- start:454 stop:885 length:432 start_codon:yes stop_codon:yes gene_type:complete
MDSNNIINIYTDGACSGNPGPGGWGAYIDNAGLVTELSGREEDTTNNRMELKAVIEALNSFTSKTNLNLYTDSKYVMDGSSKWIENWKKNGWKTAQKKAVKNQDLWIELDKLVHFHQIHWVWVKGHDGNLGNERADYLATSAI